MPQANREPATGKLLAALPMMGDMNFERSVVLITEHGPDGTVGFVINRPLDIDLRQLKTGLPQMEAPLYQGGPVNTEHLFFVHRKGHLIPESRRIMGDIYWGGALDPLKEMMALQLITQEDIRFFLGYSGWSPGQLQGEIEQKSWLVEDLDAVNIFDNSPEEIWKEIIKKQGDDELTLWLNSPLDPNLN